MSLPGYAALAACSLCGHPIGAQPQVSDVCNDCSADEDEREKRRARHERWVAQQEDREAARRKGES